MISKRRAGLFFRNFHGQAFASLGPTTLENVSSRLVFHSLSKTVFTFRLDFTGLEGSFHDATSSKLLSKKSCFCRMRLRKIIFVSLCQREKIRFFTVQIFFSKLSCKFFLDC